MSKFSRLATNTFAGTIGTLSFLTVLAIILPATAQAQWSIEPALRVGGEKDDNPTLTFRTDDVKDTTGLLLDRARRSASEARFPDLRRPLP